MKRFGDIPMFRAGSGLTLALIMLLPALLPQPLPADVYAWNRLSAGDSLRTPISTRHQQFRAVAPDDHDSWCRALRESIRSGRRAGLRMECGDDASCFDSWAIIAPPPTLPSSSFPPVPASRAEPTVRPPSIVLGLPHSRAPPPSIPSRVLVRRLPA